MIARSNNVTSATEHCFVVTPEQVAFWVSTKILAADESYRINTIEKMVEIADVRILSFLIHH